MPVRSRRSTSACRSPAGRARTCRGFCHLPQPARLRSLCSPRRCSVRSVLPARCRTRAPEVIVPTGGERDSEDGEQQRDPTHQTPPVAGLVGRTTDGPRPGFGLLPLLRARSRQLLARPRPRRHARRSPGDEARPHRIRCCRSSSARSQVNLIAHAAFGAIVGGCVSLASRTASAQVAGPRSRCGVDRPRCTLR